MRQPDALDESVPAVPDDRAPGFESMMDDWPDRATSRYCQDLVHRLDVERATQPPPPPVVNVTVPGVGLFSGPAGGGEVAYSPDSRA